MARVARPAFNAGELMGIPVEPSGVQSDLLGRLLGPRAILRGGHAQPIAERLPHRGTDRRHRVEGCPLQGQGNG